MKLNTPETAPKDSSIFLAQFNGRRWIEPAAWVEEYENMPACWVAAKIHRNAGFFNIHYGEQDLTGWLPMPKIDDQGNVR